MCLNVGYKGCFNIVLKMVNFGFFFFLVLLEFMLICIDGKLFFILLLYFVDIVEWGEWYNFFVCSIVCNREFDIFLFV